MASSGSASGADGETVGASSGPVHGPTSTTHYLRGSKRMKMDESTIIAVASERDSSEPFQLVSRGELGRMLYDKLHEWGGDSDAEQVAPGAPMPNAATDRSAVCSYYGISLFDMDIENCLADLAVPLKEDPTENSPLYDIIFNRWCGSKAEGSDAEYQHSSDEDVSISSDSFVDDCLPEGVLKKEYTQNSLHAMYVDVFNSLYLNTSALPRRSLYQALLDRFGESKHLPARIELGHVLAMEEKDKLPVRILCGGVNKFVPAILVKIAGGKWTVLDGDIGFSTFESPHSNVSEVNSVWCESLSVSRIRTRWGYTMVPPPELEFLPCRSTEYHIAMDILCADNSCVDIDKAISMKENDALPVHFSESINIPSVPAVLVKSGEVWTVAKNCEKAHVSGAIFSGFGNLTETGVRDMWGKQLHPPPELAMQRIVNKEGGAEGVHVNVNGSILCSDCRTAVGGERTEVRFVNLLLRSIWFPTEHQATMSEMLDPKIQMDTEAAEAIVNLLCHRYFCLNGGRRHAVVLLPLAYNNSKAPGSTIEGSIVIARDPTVITPAKVQQHCNTKKEFNPHFEDRYLSYGYNGFNHYGALELLVPLGLVIVYEGLGMERSFGGYIQLMLYRNGFVPQSSSIPLSYSRRLVSFPRHGPPRFVELCPLNVESRSVVVRVVTPETFNEYISAEGSPLHLKYHPRPLVQQLERPAKLCGFLMIKVFEVLIKISDLRHDERCKTLPPSPPVVIRVEANDKSQRNARSEVIDEYARCLKAAAVNGDCTIDAKSYCTMPAAAKKPSTEKVLVVDDSPAPAAMSAIEPTTSPLVNFDIAVEHGAESVMKSNCPRRLDMDQTAASGRANSFPLPLASLPPLPFSPPRKIHPTKLGTPARAEIVPDHVAITKEYDMCLGEGDGTNRLGQSVRTTDYKAIPSPLLAEIPFSVLIAYLHVDWCSDGHIESIRWKSDAEKPSRKTYLVDVILSSGSPIHYGVGIQKFEPQLYHIASREKKRGRTGMNEDLALLVRLFCSGCKKLSKEKMKTTQSIFGVTRASLRNVTFEKHLEQTVVMNVKYSTEGCQHLKDEKYGRTTGTKRAELVAELGGGKMKPMELTAKELERNKIAASIGNRQHCMGDTSASKNLKKEYEEKLKREKGLTGQTDQDVRIVQASLVEADRAKIPAWMRTESNKRQEYLLEELGGSLRFHQNHPYYAVDLYRGSSCKIYAEAAKSNPVLYVDGTSGGLEEEDLIGSERIMHVQIVLGSKHAFLQSAAAGDAKATDDASPIVLAEFMSNRCDASAYHAFFNRWKDSCNKASGEQVFSRPAVVSCDFDAAEHLGCLRAFGKVQYIPDEANGEMRTKHTDRYKYVNEMLPILIDFDKTVLDSALDPSLLKAFLGRHHDKMMNTLSFILTVCKSHGVGAQKKWAGKSKRNLGPHKDRIATMLKEATSFAFDCPYISIALANICILLAAFGTEEVEVDLGDGSARSAYPPEQLRAATKAAHSFVASTAKKMRTEFTTLDEEGLKSVYPVKTDGDGDPQEYRVIHRSAVELAKVLVPKLVLARVTNEKAKDKNKKVVAFSFVSGFGENEDLSTSGKIPLGDEASEDGSTFTLQPIRSNSILLEIDVPEEGGKVTMPFPFFALEAKEYLEKHWLPIYPLLSFSLAIHNIATGAHVESSNQLIEALFKNMKHHQRFFEVTSDLPTYLEYWNDLRCSEERRLMHQLQFGDGRRLHRDARRNAAAENANNEGKTTSYLSDSDDETGMTPSVWSRGRGRKKLQVSELVRKLAMIDQKKRIATNTASHFEICKHIAASVNPPMEYKSYSDLRQQLTNQKIFMSYSVYNNMRKNLYLNENKSCQKWRDWMQSYTEAELASNDVDPPAQEEAD